MAASQSHLVDAKILRLIACLIVVGCAAKSFSQDATNKRGFQPGGSYAIGDFESINTTNGNLMMHFPLASLPVGRNGLSASINLIYNSKLYESETQYFVDYDHGCQGGTDQTPCHYNYYPEQLLRRSDDGGWRYGVGYELRLVDRMDQYRNLPNEQQPNCYNQYLGLDSQYYALRYRYKLLVIFPDGSSHEMRPNGWSDGNGDDPLRDYFDIRPDGYWNTCTSETWVNQTLTYYSIDGSFLRLDIQHDSDGYWQTNPWTLYMPDGSKVVTGANTPQRMYDRNSNYVEIDNVDNYNNTGYPATQIVDQLGRSITRTSDGTDDLIISQGFGDTLTWKVSWKSIAPYKNYWPCSQDLQCPIQVQQQETFGMAFSVVDTITLPSQAGSLHYTFGYNAPDYQVPYVSSTGWGELSSVTLPDGSSSPAHLDYQYQQDGTAASNYTGDILRNSVSNKSLTYNREYDGSSNQTTETWTYDIERTGSSISGPDGGMTTQIFVDTQGTYWNSGQVYLTVHPDGSKTETLWAWNNLGSDNTNAYPRTEFTSIKNAAGTYVQTAIKDYRYDKNGNVTRIDEYDWVPYANVPRDSQGQPTGGPSGATLIRTTLNGYVATTPDAGDSAGSNTYIYWSSGSPNLRKALAWSEVRDGSNQPLTRTEFSYDDGLSTGNLTQQTRWDSSKGAYSNPLTTSNSISVTSQYANWGNGNTGKLTQTTDARGTITALTYGLIGGYDIYPTQTVAASGTSIARTETRTYDFGTGLVTSATDADNNVTSSTTYDVFGRPTLVKAADGKSEETRTATEYSDSDRRVIVRSDLNSVGDAKLVSIQHYDQLGRIRLARQLEDSTNSNDAYNEQVGIKVQTRYAITTSNSYVVTSNPYRANYSTNAGSEVTMGWTRSKSDNAGRMMEVQTFSGATLPSPWDSNTTTTGTVTTAYDANLTTVTDQASRVRRSKTDGLGRLGRVDEPDKDSGQLDSSGTPIQSTNYDYDALGNLTQVTQGTQTPRTFTYSSLSRLLSAANPESGTITYQYDSGGNLLVKTDARSVSSHYEYDALSRVTRRWYNSSNEVSATTQNSPALSSTIGASDQVSYSYDTATYGKGRLASVSSSVSSYSYGSYDALGRVLTGTQTIGSQPYSTTYGYDRAGHVTSMTYPSSHVVNYNYDNAGRLADKDSTHLAFTGNLGDGSSTLRTYASGLSYATGGQMIQEQFGTSAPIYNQLVYNSRGQLAEILAGTGTSGNSAFNRGKIVNDYSTTDNNGNLKQQTTYVPNDDANTSPTSWYQLYDYDNLNRLTKVREFNSGATQLWQQAFTFDRYGNRMVDVANTSDGIPKLEFAVDTTHNNNQLIVPAGYSGSGSMHYDAAGNLDIDTYSAAAFSRVYDAENRMTQEKRTTTEVTGTYSYDGDGHRVKRVIGSTETWQVYGVGGELIAEYAANTAAYNPQKEYGYRNGQLLITADAPVTGSGGWGAPPAFTGPDPLSKGDDIKLENLTELRTAVNSLRAHAGLPAYNFTVDSSPVRDETIVKADHIRQLREALEGARTALGLSNGGYAHPTLTENSSLIYAIDFQELRTQIRSAWNNGEVKLPLVGAVSSRDHSAGYDASHAINGNLNDLWSAGDYAPQWIQVDLGQARTISRVRLLVDQSPSGHTTHQVYGGPTTDSLSLLGTFDGDTVFHQWLELSASASNIRYIKVSTTVSPSWVGWAEIEVYGPAGTTSSVHWLVADQLGTPRMIFDQTGSLTVNDLNGNYVSGMTRHDYLPFGEELFAGTGGRTTAQGYSASDGIRQKFTQKERDNETGLDYFEARYYASTQGRFTSVDPYNIAREVQITATEDPEKAKAQLDSYLSFPQQWNRYGYTANNPLKYVDPSGQLIELTGETQADRDEAMSNLRFLVGNEAGKHLGVRQEKGKDGKTHYYVTSDANLCDVGSKSPTIGFYVSEMIDRKDRIIEFQMADSFKTKYGSYTTESQGGAATVGAEESLTGHTQVFMSRQASGIAEAQFNTALHRGKFDPYNNQRVWAEDDVVLAHEFGHAYANAIENKAIYGSHDTDFRADEWENLQRGIPAYKDRNQFIRRRH